jgi:outer membrane protein assembly factor BamB
MLGRDVRGRAGVTEGVLPVRRNHSYLVAILLALAAAGRGAETPRFTDPAPPRVERPAPVTPPPPQKQEGLRFHAPPKPLAPGAVTHDWRSFLGPTHNAVSTETPLLKHFGKNGPAIVWEVPKGEGFASPAVVGPRVLLFHRIGNEEVVECLQAETGRRYWRYGYPTSYRDRYGWNGGPRCPPISDGEYAYTFGAEGKLHCLKLTTGQVVWKRDIFREFRLRQSFFGVGTTPLIEGNLLIVNVGANGGPCVTSGRAGWSGAPGTSGVPAMRPPSRRPSMAGGACSSSPAGKAERRGGPP